MSPKSIIYLIIYLLLYWIGGKKTKKTVQDEARNWIPDEVVDAIPLRMILPGEKRAFLSIQKTLTATTK